MKGTVFIVHGLGGSGPEHWQTWLAGRLAERSIDVRYPNLPSPDAPSLDAWLDALAGELDDLDPNGLRVACHSLGSVAWLHLASRTTRRLAERVLLVALPSASAGVPEIAGFVPAPLDAAAVERAAGETRIVCADHGDPYCPEGPRLWEPLGVPIDLIKGGGHLNTDAGWEWPAIEAWCLGADNAPVEA